MAEKFSDDQIKKMISDGTMTWEVWASLTPAQRVRTRDESSMVQELRAFEGKRVQALDMDGNRVRFNVGLSGGWKPVHLRLHNRKSTGGNPIYAGWVSNVRLVE